MKEFNSGSGGRYVYSEDFHNLQELSLSINSIFEGCDNFVISGCEVSGATISAGYVWINGRIRRFDGATGIKYPYYIFETNRYVATEYKDEPNKLGQTHYLSTGGATIPLSDDGVTGELPEFIEITAEYTPRITDQFFGKHALILNTPNKKQVVSKDVDFVGNISSQKQITSSESVGVKNSKNGYIIKSYFKPTGEASVGLHLNNSTISEVVFTNNGAIKIFKGKTEVAEFSDATITLNKAFYAPKIKTAELVIEGCEISNQSDATDSGSVMINRVGYKGGNSKFRDLTVYDGKGDILVHIEGQQKSTLITTSLAIAHQGDGLVVANASVSKDNIDGDNRIKFAAIDGDMAHLGFAAKGNGAFEIINLIGDIDLKPIAAVNISGSLKVKGIDIADTYVHKEVYIKNMKKKVDVIDGKGLSSEDFTSALKEKLDQIKLADVANNTDGLISLDAVNEMVGARLLATNNLSDIKDFDKARASLNVYSAKEVDKLLSGKLDSSHKYTGEVFTKAHLEKLGGIVEGRFESIDDEGKPIAKVNGYVTINKILFELKKYAPLTLDNYSAEQKKTVADNLGVYTKTEADEKFMVPSKLFESYIEHIVKKQEKSKTEAQSILRGQIGAASSESLDGYIKKNALLSDLDVKDEKAQKAICAKIGAAFMNDYQEKLKDTGWLPLSLTGVYIRQVGNTVCIQGECNTSASANNTLFDIPNNVQPPAHSVQFEQSDTSDKSHNRNFIARIAGGSRRCVVINNRIAGSRMAFTITYMV